MFIINTFRGSVKADFDEIEKIINSKGALVFLRNGAINPKHITHIVPDVEERSMVFREIGETREDVERRIREYQSKDIFAHMRNVLPSLNNPGIKQLL